MTTQPARTAVAIALLLGATLSCGSPSRSAASPAAPPAEPRSDPGPAAPQAGPPVSSQPADGDSVPVEPAAGGTRGGSVLSADGTYRATWTPIPSPVPLNEPFALRVAIEPVDAGPVDAPDGDAPALELRVDARMPEHFHGMNRTPRVVRTGPHTFEVRGLLFHMSGRWVLHFDIEQQGVTERARDEVHLP